MYWIYGPQMVTLFGEIMESLGDGIQLEGPKRHDLKIIYGSPLPLPHLSLMA